MHESTRKKIDESLECYKYCKNRNEDLIYLFAMKIARINKFWSDSVEEIEQYVAEKTILKDGV